MKHRKSTSLSPSRSPTLSRKLSGDLRDSQLTQSRALAIQSHGFVELLARSNFSFLSGASHPEEMVRTAKRLGYRGLGLCDINGVYGSVRGYQAHEYSSSFDTEEVVSNLPFNYLVGVELTPRDASPLAIMPMNKEGYKALCHFITKIKRPANKGEVQLQFSDLLLDTEELLAFPLPPWNLDHLDLLLDAYKDRLYLPVTKDFTWESVENYQRALQIEHDFKIPLFATQRPLFHTPERKILHDVLTCIQNGETLTNSESSLTLNAERHLHTLSEIAHRWRERPDMLERTLEINSRIHFSLSELRYQYPRESLPAAVTSSDHLRALCEKGVRWRFPNGADTKLIRQLNNELALIEELEYEDYFLTLYEICEFAKAQKIVYQGRGSAANSVVCFVLGLTNIDPVQMNLLFERFISRERGEPPDIDIDFEHERREEVIQHIYKKYGERHAAMVCTVICYRSRMALREVAKTFGLPLEKINALIKYMGREGLSRLLQDPPCMLKMGLDRELFMNILSLANELKGFPRHIGIHTGGFVIAREPIMDLVPVEKATMTDRYVIQWNKDDVDTLKMMKIDVLSLGMLTALRKSLDMLRSHKNIDWNLAQIPHEDAQTYAMIQKADTVGVFQIESRAQMSLLPRLKPKTYYDLVIEVAIVRPGPIQGGMVHPFLKRRAGLEKIEYAHPKLKPILQKTLGIPLFQEQIMQVVIAVAGFTPGEADELRRLMSSSARKQHMMDNLRQRLLTGMLNNGISKDYAEKIYRTIEGFSSYGFPESHSASFALITYASCYIKCHFPDVFACALLNSQPMGFYSPRQLIADAQRHHVQFLPVDVQTSNFEYRLLNGSTDNNLDSSKSPTSSASHSQAGEPLAKIDTSPSNERARIGLHPIRVGFNAIQGLHRAHVDKLVVNRNTHGPFKSLQDLVTRTAINKNSLLRLAAAGALESLGVKPREAIWKIQSLDFDKNSFFYGS